MELLAGILFAATVLVSLAVVLAWLFVTERRDKASLLAWADLARARRLAVGSSRSRAVLLRFEGRHAGVDFTLDVLKVDGGTRLVTRLRARASEAHDVHLAAWTRGAPAPSEEGTTALRANDVAFDQTFELRADDPAAARMRLGPALRQALLRFPTPLVGGGFAFRYERGDVALEWPGAEAAAIELDAALVILACACPLSRDALRAMN